MPDRGRGYRSRTCCGLSGKAGTNCFREGRYFEETASRQRPRSERSRTRIRSIEGEEKELADRLGEIAAEHGDVSEEGTDISSELHALRQQRDDLRNRMDLLRSALEAEEAKENGRRRRKLNFQPSWSLLDARIMSKQAFLADCGSRLGMSANTVTSLRRKLPERKQGFTA